MSLHTTYRRRQKETLKLFRVNRDARKAEAAPPLPRRGAVRQGVNRNICPTTDAQGRLYGFKNFFVQLVYVVSFVHVNFFGIIA